MTNLSLKKFTQYALIIAVVYLGVSYLPELIRFGGVIWSAASPLVIGCVMAYVLNILLVRLEKIYFPNSQKDKKSFLSVLTVLFCLGFWMSLCSV